jgi:hypothetical protein
MKRTLMVMVSGLATTIAVLFVILSGQAASPAVVNESGVQATFFTADSTEIDRGGQVTFSWDVKGVDSVAIEQYYGYKTGYDVRYADLPATGSLTVTLDQSQPTEYYSAQPYIYGASFFLLLPDTKPSVWYSSNGVLGNLSVTIRCPENEFFFGLDPQNSFCPIAPAETVDVIYQPFEDGFMIQRGDTGTVYSFYKSPDIIGGPGILFSAANYAEWENIPKKKSEIPAGLAQPEGALGKVWDNSHHALVDGLGWATGPEVHYQTPIQDSYAAMLFHPVMYLTLPDGQLIRYVTGSYGGAYWSEVELDGDKSA